MPYRRQRGQIRIDGGENTFDFTHINDAVSGVVSFIRQLMRQSLLPPIHLVTGNGTTLAQLARLALKYGNAECTIRECPSRSFDVSKFYGAPVHAEKFLNWSASISIETGVRNLVNAFKTTPH